MKHFLTALLLFIVSFASAQIVNIPDPNFKQFLLNYTGPQSPIDINADGEIQVSEALALGSLYITGSNGNPALIQDLTGIREFANVQTIEISGGSQITTCDVSDLTHLLTLNVQYAPLLTFLNVDGCTNLNAMYLTNLKLERLAPNAHKLTQLDFYSNLVPLTSIDLTACDSLNNINFTSSTTDTFNISGLTKLFSVSVYGSCKTFIAHNCPILGGIQFQSGSVPSLLHSVDIIDCPALNTFNMQDEQDNTVTSLDFSSCLNLQYIMLYANAATPLHVNIKNGSMLQNFYDWGFGGNLFICADDFEVPGFTVSGWGYDTVYVSSNCSAFPGGNYNTIKGKLSIDADFNGCDINDPGLNMVPVKITDNSNGSYIIRYTYTNGEYRHYPYAGNFTIAPYFAYPYFNLLPVSANINFASTGGLTDSANFCISPNGVHNDLQVNFLPGSSPARPGMTAEYKLIYKNNGNTTMSGNVTVNFENSKMNFTNASINPLQSPGLLTWNYNNLLPFESRTITVYLTLLPAPTNNVGDTLTYLATINPVNNDETPFDNNFILPQRVVGSIDPNDKLCIEGSKIDITSIANPLHYIIHFQNIGNDTAFNVVVDDILTDKLDWNSFEVIGISAPCTITRKDSAVKFFFENIKLPYQAINDAGSNGYVAFSVKPKSTVAIGDSINNNALIYFDFNTPVKTNKTITVVSDLSTVPVKLEYFSLISKENANQLTWKVTTTDLSTTFNVQRSNDGIHFSDIGNITATAQRCQLPFNFTDDKPLNGKNYYRIKITDANGISFYSKILVAGNTRSGFVINAVVSNQNTTTLYLNVSKDQTVQMKIIAADGRLMYAESKTIAAGTTKLNLQTGNLSKGIYTLLAYTNNGELITKRFVK